MNFLQRLWNLIRGKADTALSNMEDPEEVLNLAIKDATGEVEDFRKQVARALVDQKKLQAELQGASAIVEEWTNKAQAAVDGGDDELAREALSRRAQEEETARARYVALQQHGETVAHLKDGLRALTAKLEDAKRRRNLLVARSRNAQAKMKMADTLGGGASSLERFDEMESKVQALELEASANVEMLSEFGTRAETDFDRRFKALPKRDPSIEAALAEMKRRSLPAGPKPGLLGAPPPPKGGPDSTR
jgi:phage shock protein A